MAALTLCALSAVAFGAHHAPRSCVAPSIKSRSALIAAVAQPPVATLSGEAYDEAAGLAEQVEEWRRVDDQRRLLSEARAAAEQQQMVDAMALDEEAPRASSRLDRARARVRKSLDDDDGLPTPRVPYDPELASARFASQPMAVGLRQMRLLGPLLSFLTKVVVEVRQGTEAANREARAKELTELISSLGPAIIKAGQALSSRSDLLPAAYLRELARLQDRVPPFGNAEACNRIEDELGKPLGLLFRHFGDEPVAAASLGQVYRAETMDGRRVAVKVQRPGCEATIALDLYILRSYSQTVHVTAAASRSATHTSGAPVPSLLPCPPCSPCPALAHPPRGVMVDRMPRVPQLTSLFNLLGRDLDLVSVIDDFGNLLYAEMDYVLEADNARRFTQLYGSLPNVSAPTVHADLSTSSVLTMEWIDGVRLTDRDGLARLGLCPAALVDTLVQCSMRQMLGNGFFHADPHAGNLLVTPTGRLVWLDFGMMSYLASEQRSAPPTPATPKPPAHPHPPTTCILCRRRSDLPVALPALTTTHPPRNSALPLLAGTPSSRRSCIWSTVTSVKLATPLPGEETPLPLRGDLEPDRASSSLTVPPPL